jgi:hypothetical protein
MSTHPFDRMAKLIISLSSGKDTDALHRSPQEIMLELVEKYGHFSHMQGVQSNGISGHAGPTKVVSSPDSVLQFILARSSSATSTRHRSS